MKAGLILLLMFLFACNNTTIEIQLNAAMMGYIIGCEESNGVKCAGKSVDYIERVKQSAGLKH